MRAERVRVRAREQEREIQKARERKRIGEAWDQTLISDGCLPAPRPLPFALSLALWLSLSHSLFLALPLFLLIRISVPLSALAHVLMRAAQDSLGQAGIGGLEEAVIYLTRELLLEPRV